MVHNLYFGQTKFALLSDPHLMRVKPEGRTDDVEETSFRKFEYVLDYCEKKMMPLLISGDLVDAPRSWHLFKRLVDLFQRFKGVKVFSVYGQHDSYMRDTRGTTILGCLNDLGLVRVLEKEIFVIHDQGREKWNKVNVIVYGSSFEGMIPLPLVFRKMGEVRKVLVIHAPIAPGVKPYGKTDPRRFLGESALGYDLVLCGDIHEKFKFSKLSHKGKAKRWIVNTGPLMRAEATEAMRRHKPCFFVWDAVTGELETRKIPCQEPEEVLSFEHLDRKRGEDQLLETFIAAIKKGVNIRRGKVSKTFLGFARQNDIEGEVAGFIFDLLREVEDERAGKD